ncbi:MAG TPA: LLM class F420-dependent oxidoreductase [Solirubrobacteraceae bacterium]|nr:LLM class F420-dependent oxidoreductase [Solirubrobacteraceae bacterium]
MPDTRWGLTLPFAGVALADHAPFFRLAEELGYDDLWTGDTAGPDGFTPLVLAAAHTERIRLATGIVNPFTRGPAVLAQHCAALADASRGRFVLGLGASSNVIVERWNGIPFERPLTKVRETVEELRPVLAGGRGRGGFKLESPPAEPVPIVIAALRGRMLRLAAEIGDGAFTNFLPLSGLPRIVAELRAGEAAAGRAEGSTELACRFFCIPQPAEEGLATARFLFSAYATVPVYTAFFRWLGWGDQLDPMVEAWRGGDRKAALDLVPDELVREIFVFGSFTEQRARLTEFEAGGISTLILTPICGPDRLREVIEGLAAARR